MGSFSFFSQPFRLFAILLDDLETDRSIKNLTDISRHIKKIQLFQQVFNLKLFRFSMYSNSHFILSLHDLQIVCKPFRKPRKCQIHEKHDGTF